MASGRPADFRFPTPKQERAEEMARRIQRASAGPPLTDRDLWWESVLADPRANATVERWASPDRMLADITHTELRVECLKCFKIVEVQTADVRRFFGGGMTWREAGKKMLEAACTSSTGSRDDDGCWPEFRRDYRGR